MNTKELIKKYWFVGLVAILFVVFLIVYSKQTIETREVKVSGLKHDGKDVVFKIGDDNYFYADDLYNELYTMTGNSAAFNSLFQMLLNKEVETTEEMKTEAANQVAGILANYDEQTIESAMAQAGYSGIDALQDYCLDSLKYTAYMKKLYTDNYDAYVAPVMEAEAPRNVSHILIKVADVETITNDDGTETYNLKPTQEETDKLNAVLEKLKDTSVSFADVASEYSDDSSATSGGDLGFATKSTSQYVEEFANVAFALNNGEVSEVVESRYGYHIITVTIPTFEELLDNNDFLQILAQYNINVDAKTLVSKMDEFGVEIVDEELQKFINENLLNEVVTEENTEEVQEENAEVE